MAHPVVKQKYTYLQSIEEMYLIESYISVNKNESADAAIRSNHFNLFRA